MKKFFSVLVLGMFLALPLAYAGEHGGSDMQEHGGTAVSEPAAAPAVAPAAADEDANANGVLDAGEDANGNGVLDTVKKEEAAK